MFGKRNAARAEQAALLRSLGEKLDALTGEIRALREENGVTLGEVKALRAKLNEDELTSDVFLGALEKMRLGIEDDFKLLSDNLDASFGAHCEALREQIEKDCAVPEGERDPDVLTEGERFNKWLMGEKGDGI